MFEKIVTRINKPFTQKSNIYYFQVWKKEVTIPEWNRPRDSYCRTVIRGKIYSRPVILNRGPHGPPGGNLQVLGRNTEQLGNWGGMDPFGGNQQIAINSPGCSSGWRIVAASPVFVYVTLRPEGSSALRQDTVPRPKWTLGLWRTTFLAPMHSYFWQKWKCMHYRHNEFQNFVQNLALDAHDALHRKSTLAFIRHCSRVEGGL